MTWADDVAPVAVHGPGLGRRALLAGALGVGAVTSAVFERSPAQAAIPGGIGLASALTPGTYTETATMPANIRDYGAVGDGTTDDSAAVQAAVDAAQADGRSVFVPAGQYQIATPVRADGPLTIRGEGMWESIFVVGADAGFVDAATHARVLVLEDLAFDLDGGAPRCAMEIDGSFVTEFVIRRCRFAQMAGPGDSTAAVKLAQVGLGEFTDCLWHNSASYAGQGTGVKVLEPPAGGHRLRFAGNNRFLWLNNGIKIRPNVWQHAEFANDPPTVLQHLEVDGAYFDSFWWLLPAAHEGEGSGVTYTATTVTDPSADFSNGDANPRPNVINVRAMPVRRSGTVTSATATLLVDSSADFLMAGVKRMDVVRSSGRWAVIAVQPWSSTAATSVQIEEWFDDTTLLPTTPPPAGASYVLYGMIIGAAVSKTTTSLTVEDWRDLYGNVVLPSAGTHYEVLPIRPTHQVFVGPGGVLKFILTNSTFRRSWADMCASHAQSSRIIGNVFEDGQEAGVVLSSGGFHHIFMGNTLNHIGNGPVFIQGNECQVIGNRTQGCWWKLDRDYAADIGLINGRRNYVAYNISTAGPETQGIAAAVKLQQDPDFPEPTQPNETTENVLAYNRRYGNTSNEADVLLWFRSGPIEGNEIIGSRKVALLNGTTGQHLEINGSGSPEGAVAASPGSVYLRSDGSAGSAMYVKESGTGTTGWTGLGSGSTASASIARKLADTVRNNTAARSADPELTIPVSANSAYLVEGYVHYLSSTVADLSIQWTAPAGSALDWSFDGPQGGTASGASTTVNLVGQALGTTPRVGGTSDEAVCRPVGMLTVGATSGSLTLTWGQATAEVSDTIVRAGSWVRLTPLG